jgi:2-polyprenyl-6-methoxyphenol hydroxylase-like FAD-dependent oxidoreductase
MVLVHMIEEVIIVGGGPTGLMLACELRLAGVRPIVIEQLAAPTGLSKALGLGGRAVDLLDHRGLLQRFEHCQPPTMSIAGFFHFGGIPIDVTRLEGRPPQFLFVLQATTERLLEERAHELGVDLRRSHEVVNLEQNADAVHLTVHTPEGTSTLHAQFVVGCDGGRSSVRELGGIAFPGTAPTRLLRLGDVKIPALMENTSWHGGRPPFPPLDGGYFRVITVEPYPDNFDRSAPMTLEELRDSVRRTTGKEVPMSDARWLSRFTDSSRQAEQYRKGRILLAGDAAHIQLPAGGPGLSTGLSDAVNLGWKLAAEIRRWAPLGLLDSYHGERHPVGARMLMHTRAQGVILSPGEHAAALRQVVTELMLDQQTLRRLVDLLQGNDVRYNVGDDDAHELAGKWAPDLTLSTENGRVRIADLMHKARGLLIDFGDSEGLRAHMRNWSDRIDVVTAQCAAAPSEGLLIRPDGYVAWAGVPGAGLQRSLQRWFGNPLATSFETDPSFSN